MTTNNLAAAAPMLQNYSSSVGDASKLDISKDIKSARDSVEVVDTIDAGESSSSSTSSPGLEPNGTNTNMKPAPPDQDGDQDEDNGKGGRKSEPVVTRRELWAYYMYYNGDNGVGPGGFSMTLFQSLANAAGFDPSKGPGSPCDPAGPCVVPWGTGTKAISSVVLVANGVSFAIMTLIFTTIGSAADYGVFGRWLLFAVTCVCWGAQYSSMALTKPSRWTAAMALYIVGYTSYGATLVFYAAAFPRLARNTAKARLMKEKYENGEVDKATLEKEESLEKNRISNISTTHSNIGYIVVLCLNLSILLPLANHPLANNYVLVMINTYWVVTGIWWFIFQQHRPGPPLPKGQNYLTIGWKQIWETLKQYKELPYTFTYLFAFFLLADGLNTTGTLVAICQNDKFSFSFLQNTYLGLVQAITSTSATLGYWHVQRYFGISTKKMFVVTNVVTVFIPFWGMLGLWTNKIGFHNEWEFWAYNAVFGLFQAPYYAYSQTMMAELTPPGFDNMFFGLFGLSNRASSMIGPNVIQAVIDSSDGNNWMGFPFLFAISFCAAVVIWFGVDVERGRRDAEEWCKRRKVGRGKRVDRAGGLVGYAGVAYV